jgi:DNA-binding transcriptional LysR family regulator
MSVSLTKIRGFLHVARHLNFRRAAEELKITQPALSGQIKALEAELGVNLFARTTRSVRLTTDGERFLLRSRRLMEAFDSTVVDMAQGASLERGTVTFSCIPTIAAHAFPRIIREFKRHHPGVRVEMTDDTTVAMERRILSGEVEFGIGGSPRWTDELEFAPILEDPFVVMCRKDHALARFSRVSIDRVLKYPIVSLGKGSNVRNTLAAYFTKAERRFEPEYELIHHYSIGALVEAGLGITLLPSMACDMIRTSSALRLVALDDRKFTRAVGLITRRGQSLSPAAHRFYMLAAKTMTMKQKARKQ